MKWTEYKGKGVAIPIQWAGRVPFLSVVRVLSPLEFVGEYYVIDYCGACLKEDYPNMVWFDFLDVSHATYTILFFLNANCFLLQIILKEVFLKYIYVCR